MRILQYIAQATLLIAFILLAVALNVDWAETPVGDASMWQAPEGGGWYTFEAEELAGTTMVKVSVFVVLAATLVTLVAALLGFAGSLSMGVLGVVASLTTLTGSVLFRVAVERRMFGLDAEPLHGTILAWVAAGLSLMAGILAIQSAVMARNSTPQLAPTQTTTDAE